MILEREADPKATTFSASTALGTAHLGAGRADEAPPILEAPIASASRRPQLGRFISAARFALGRALWEIEGERPRAVALAKAAALNALQ